jgi:hypothetical protein
MSSTRIETLIDEVQAAFDRRPTDIEAGLDVEDAALLQLRKACRLLAGAESAPPSVSDGNGLVAESVAIRACGNG